MMPTPNARESASTSILRRSSSVWCRNRRYASTVTMPKRDVASPDARVRADGNHAFLTHSVTATKDRAHTKDQTMTRNWFRVSRGVELEQDPAGESTTGFIGLASLSVSQACLTRRVYGVLSGLSSSLD